VEQVQTKRIDSKYERYPKILKRVGDNKNFCFFMESNSLEKLARGLNPLPMQDECIVLNDDQAEDIYGGDNTYNNCPITYNNCHI